MLEFIVTVIVIVMSLGVLGQLDDAYPTKPLETEGIFTLGKENPLLLAKICSENFLPPTQLLHALDALEHYENISKLYPHLKKLLDHYSKPVVNKTLKILFRNFDDVA
jgi:hypothetical protein